MTEHKAHSSIKKVIHFFFEYMYILEGGGANEKENNINNYFIFNFELYVKFKITNQHICIWE